MSDPIRAALQALVTAYYKHGGKWSQHHQEALDDAVDHARTALAAAPPAPVISHPLPVATSPALIFAPINGWTACINGKLAGIYSDRDGHPGHLLWSADPGLTPPAPDPREALAARPLLEAVARMADRIGQHTVSEITAISDRAAHWLAQNPPGQPVAIEPRGCPTPGACSCVEPPAPAPTINDIFELCEDHEFHLGRDGANEEESAEGLLQIIRVALSRWGNQPPAPDHLRTATEMVADGEREELAVELQQVADALNDEGLTGSARPVRRAAALLRQPAPAADPQPVGTLHVSDFRGYTNYEFQQLGDLPVGQHKLFTAPPAPAPAAAGEREELAQWLDTQAVYYEGLSPEGSAKACRAAALLRQPAPTPEPPND